MSERPMIYSSPGVQTVQMARAHFELRRVKRERPPVSERHSWQRNGLAASTRNLFPSRNWRSKTAPFLPMKSQTLKHFQANSNESFSFWTLLSPPLLQNSHHLFFPWDHRLNRACRFRSSRPGTLALDLLVWWDAFTTFTTRMVS